MTSIFSSWRCGLVRVPTSQGLTPPFARGVHDGRYAARRHSPHSVKADRTLRPRSKVVLRTEATMEKLPIKQSHGLHERCSKTEESHPDSFRKSCQQRGKKIR
ncbi:MAG: hypothetical protein ABIO17_10275 [Pseudoxanthomonas sp.]